MEFDYNSEFFRGAMMGPNAVRILAELGATLRLEPGSRVLDLGCGMGLTSMYLAQTFDVQVFATDLWISATDNFERFRACGLGEKVVPIHADAVALPYADGFFDAVVSVDSYHYFGAGEGFLDAHIAPLVKEGGTLAIAVPGLRHELETVPEEMEPFWTGDMNFHDCAWWKSLWQKSNMVKDVRSFSLESHAAAWADWLACDEPHAKHDVEMMRIENGNYFATVGITARKK
ncbi:SAM-dependent methyltransferase [Christensenella intestinihominis]|uniref:SAM-dependent methyltransferase n=1 Tax=Christensenella intestinihominis TaxID=1851429 RepID=UPI00082E44CA|nr:methyltransferase domain-containing protein [Christensenella intestinihominis]